LNLIGIPGLLLLLGVAWAISVERLRVRLRPILWGIVLQLLLGLTVLRDDLWSFVGMALVGLLVIAYLADRGGHGLEIGPAGTVAALVGAAAVGSLLMRAPATALAYFGAALALFLLLAGRRGRAPRWRTLASGLLVVSTISWLYATRLPGRELFERIGIGITELLTLADYGSRFLFGNLVDESLYFPGPDSVWPGFGYLFAFKLLPVIVFFGGLMAILYYYGVMQRAIEALSHFLRWTVGTSGAETLCCSANIFIGQTEAPLLIRPYVEETTDSELFTLMVAGFATLSGGSIAAYAAMGIPADHLIAASVMSAPAALMIAKIVYPELGHPQTAGDVALPSIDAGANVIEAATSGISDGLRLAVNVGAMLIGFIALIAVVDVVLNFVDSLVDGRLLPTLWPDRGFGAAVHYSTGGMSPVSMEYTGVVPGSLQALFGLLLRPLAWLLGVPWAEAGTVGSLLGLKLSLNEFVAYSVMRQQMAAGLLSERSIALATYALCGFANFASVGIQIGGFAALAPGRKAELSRFGVRAMVAGALASWATAAVAGLFL
jgi:CNT family concentrative nucleoside transporter